MKKWIRWQGLLAFAVLSILLAVFWIIFVDIIVERSIESYGTRAVGAKVELAEADLKLFPLGLTLKEIAVTNPDQPMENIVQISRAAFLLEPLYLLWRKVIIAEMSLEGVRMNTARKTSGAVADVRKREPAEISKKPSGGFCDTARLPSFDELNVQTILSREKLESLELIQNFEKEFEATRSDWQKRLQELPSKEKLDDYRKRVDRLKSGGRGLGGLLGAAGDLTSLQQEIQSDLNRLKDAQQQFEPLKNSFSAKIQNAAAAPLKDVERLQQKYALSPQGVDNLGKLVLGQKICGGLEKAAQWYERLRSVLERAGPKGDSKKKEVRPLRGKGTDVRFKESAPQPDFLIRRASVSFVHEIGELSGRIENITPDQDVLGRPLTFKLIGEKLKGLHRADLDGSLNRVNPAKPLDRIDLKLQDYQVQNVSLSRSEDLPVIIKGGLANIALKAEIAGESLQADLAAGLKSAAFGAGQAGGKGPIIAAISSALSQLTGFNLKLALNGTLSDYQVRLSTDLDQILKSAAGQIVRQQAQKFEGELKQAVFAKTGGPLEGLKSEKNGFDAIGSQLAERLNLGNNLLGNAKRLL